ncbi:hypothetical protein KC909_00990 [Candidatus Dojkabacteria bacterium]|uniref:Uncharacterized protein n=1 Tax=Candidatus Dojkabacteria bacterium TaxID=2099670 RepID=A0A955RIM8_9BACT|nr:hypothetical protein [Candidatus Dojkabacteria bacterium]
MELIVISGWYGTEVAKELLYDVISKQNGIKVRRNIKEVWWDFTIPLSILGYRDRKRNFIEWWWLLTRAWTYLLLGPSNPHTLILSVDSNVESIVKYWGSFIKPDILLVLNDNEDKLIIEKLIKNVDKEKGMIIYNDDTLRKSLKKLVKKHSTFTYGRDKGNDLVVKQNKQSIEMKYKKSQIKINTKNLRGFSDLILGGITATALSLDINIEDIGFEAVKFQIPTRLLAKIKSNLIEDKL